MAALKDIKRKIKGIQKTRQITKAMNMVAAAKFKTAYGKMENFRAYSSELERIFTDLLRTVELDSHPLLAVRDSGRIRAVVISSDRGLCGSFNTNLFKFTEAFLKEKKGEKKEVSLIPVGRKGRDYFRRKLNLADERTDVLANLDISQVSGIIDPLAASFLASQFDELYLIYNHFVNASLQRPKISRLLPMAVDLAGLSPGKAVADCIYEPQARVLLDRLFPLQLQVQLYQALVETAAGENGARMAAMDNATKNCDELNRSLTLKYNKARQAAITAELMDIVGGAEALAQG